MSTEGDTFILRSGTGVVRAKVDGGTKETLVLRDSKGSASVRTDGVAEFRSGGVPGPQGAPGLTGPKGDKGDA